MSGFAKLTPAFTAHIALDTPSIIGPLSRGTSLFHVVFRSGEGFLKSEPGYSIPVDAVFAHGSDYIRADPDGKHVRLQVDSVLKDASGAVIKYSYTGTIDMGGAAGKVLMGANDAATTDFGEAFTHVTFETGSEDLRELEHKVYVASGRFIIEAGKPVIVEYKISEVSC